MSELQDFAFRSGWCIGIRSKYIGYLLDNMNLLDDTLLIGHLANENYSLINDLQLIGAVRHVLKEKGEENELEPFIDDEHLLSE